MRLSTIKLISLFLISLFLNCLSPATKLETIEINRKLTEKTFDYAPEASDIDVRFEVSENDLVGKLYKKEQTKFQVAKKEVKSFVYDKDGNLEAKGGSNYWSMPNIFFLSFGCFYTLCINIPFTIYYYYSENSSLGEKRKFTETEITKAEFGEFKPNLFNNEFYSITLNDNKPLIVDSSFKVPLDYFIKNNEEEIRYNLSYKSKEIKSDTLLFTNQTITGMSPKFKQLLAANERERKREKL